VEFPTVGPASLNLKVRRNCFASNQIVKHLCGRNWNLTKPDHRTPRNLRAMDAIFRPMFLGLLDHDYRGMQAPITSNRMISGTEETVSLEWTKPADSVVDCLLTTIALPSAILANFLSRLQAPCRDFSSRCRSVFFSARLRRSSLQPFKITKDSTTVQGVLQVFLPANRQAILASH